MGKILTADVINRDDGTQSVLISEEFRFTTKTVFMEWNAESKVLTLIEGPVKPRTNMAELFRKLDEVGGEDLVIERDPWPPQDREVV